MRREHEAHEVAAVRPCSRGVYSRDLTACGIPCGLDALITCRMGVMSWLDALPKPPKSKAAHRRALRATTPFKTPVLTLFFSLVVPPKAN